MTTRDKLAIIGLLLATVAIIIGVSLFLVKPQNSSNNIVDRDTGETYDSTQNATPTGGSAFATNVHLFGIEQLITTLSNNNYSSDYVQSIKDALGTYSSDRLNNKFISLTLRPQNLSISKTLVTGQIRLGEADVIIPISIVPSSTGEVAIVSIGDDSSPYGGKFVFVGGINDPSQLQFTVAQVNDRSTDLTISTYSNREAALEFIEQLGYTIPDFSITFANNYENPFK